MTKEQKHIFRIESADLNRLPFQEKGVCSDWNSTVTSDDDAQKLQIDVWYDFDSIAIKVCSQIGHK